MGVIIVAPIGQPLPLTVLGEDTTPASTTGSATLATIAISAGVVNEYIIVIVEYGTAVTTGSGTETCSLLIDTGVTNRVTREVFSMSTTAVINGGSGGSYTFMYEPTASEKALGFNVVIKGVVAGSGTLTYHRGVVMGY